MCTLIRYLGLGLGLGLVCFEKGGLFLGGELGWNFYSFCFLFFCLFFFYCIVGCTSISMPVWTPVLSVLLLSYMHVFCICPCSAQLSMFHMERRSGNMLIIITLFWRKIRSVLQKYPEQAVHKVLALMLRRGEIQHRMQRKLLYRVK